MDGIFFLQDVQIWQEAGPPTGPHQVLLRDGFLIAVGGPDQEILPPLGAILLAPDNEEEWILYPGLLHANYRTSFAGSSESPYANPIPDSRSGPMPQMESGDRELMRGWQNATDRVEWDTAKAQEWREAGFTTAQIFPDAGLLRGHAGVVALNDRPLGEALRHRQGDSVVAFRGGADHYPGTPMASLAVLRQAFLDRDRSADWPRYADPDLDSLPKSGEFAWVLARNSREIENAMDLFRDFAPGVGIRLVGGEDAWKHAVRLRQIQASVLFVLDLPTPPKTDKELDMEAEESRPWWRQPDALREENRRLHEEKVAQFQRLLETRVPCALAPSGSLKSFQKDLKQLREAGLSAANLFQAWAPAAFRTAGQDFSWPLGRADVLVSRGPLDVVEPDFAWVFADGRGWEFPLLDEAKKDKEKTEESESDLGLAGEWLISMETPMGPQEFGAELLPDSQEVLLFDPEDKDDREPAQDVKFSGSKVSFTFSPPDMPVEMTAHLKLYGDQGEGTLETPFGEMELEVERSASAASPVAQTTENKRTDAPTKEDAKSDLGHPAWPVDTKATRLPAHPLEGTVLLQGGTLYPVDGSTPFLGDLLIEDGLIRAVGGEISTLQSVPTLDATGWHIIPGIIDPHSHLALASVNEGSMAITGECRIADMIQVESLSIFRAAAGGAAVNQSLHGSANPIGGQAAVWELDHRRPRIADLLLPGAPQGIKFALGENVRQSNWSRSSGKRFPTTRMGVQAVFRRAFTAAQDYSRRRAEHAAGRLPSFRRDVRLDVLSDILDGKIHVQCHSYRADEILMMLNICKEFGIRRPTFQHVLEGYKVASELAAFGAMASTFSDWWAYKFEVWDAIPWNVALMTKAGVTTTINSDSSEMIRRLNTEAGKSLRYGGLSVEECLKLCTLNAAKQLRVEDQLGSLEVGKHGTITAFDGPPLSTWSRCVLTLARGRTLFERDVARDSLWDRYAEDLREFAEQLAEGSETAANDPNSDEAWNAWTRAGQGLAYWIHNAVIHPISADPFSGSILVVDGRIQWLGHEAPRRPIPAHTVSVDAGGLHLYPTFLNAGDSTGLYDIGAIRSARDDRETGQDHPDLSVATAIHGDSRHIAVTRLNGVGHVLVRPTDGRIRGQAALVQLSGDITPELVVVQDLALVLAFPSVKSSKGEKEPERPKSLEELDVLFAKALAYGERRTKALTKDQDLLARDRRLEALLPYLRGEKPVMIEVNSVAQIMTARSWALEHGLDVIWTGVKDGWKVAGFLGADHARVVTGPVHALPSAPSDPYDSAYRNASLLAAAGCEVGLRTNDPEFSRNLPYQAATAGADGLGRAATWHALTLGAARVLGVDSFTGSIEVGKAANFFLAEGDVLDFTGRVRRMWLGGAEVQLESDQTELRDRWEARIDRTNATPWGK